MGKIFSFFNDAKNLLILFLIIVSIILYKVNVNNVKKADISSLKRIEAKLDKELSFWKKKNEALEEKIHYLEAEDTQEKVYSSILKKDFIRYPANETPKVLIFKKR